MIDRSRSAVAAYVLVVIADLGLGRRREDGVLEFGGIHQTGRQLDAAHRTLALVFLEPAAGKVSADDAFDRKHIGFLHEHETTAQVVLVGFELLG